MALTGKMIMYVEINSIGHVLYDIIRFTPNDFASMLPDKVHSCNLLDGQWGTVGSVMCWNFTYDGNIEVLKQELEEVNEANHKLVYKVIEAKLVDNIYKSFKIIFQVEPKNDRKVVVVTFEFEKANASMPYPTDFMDYLCNIFKGLDEYASKK